MYTDNLIKSFKFVFDDGKITNFIEKALKYLSDELKNPSPRRGEFENRVWKIIKGEGHDFSYDYLNSYLYALDELYENGAVNSLLYGKPNFRNTNASNLVKQDNYSSPIY
ncbi:hypothetical protein CHH49_10300 [Terribacillus saccharophilus]|uniref:hypothetical protein n=1 Tax=Terribacillus saccharophilus TaxID=361277 RepID=UPI000BA51964|nr:hypothetical protein [Terribacillus saccharophilus]PAF21290.1 hypothetical protein CHH49_10300 [Terribacillus saccharophilus]